ncbi:MAG: hypothetical protein PHU91_00715 [Candidatus Omnitrophica bacterium]|nr:hypothetical protein [Candidatus Omnitrophota bacterium]MDD5236181.1 hypothetical protein [Candidatus Omnitrophota bacterium]MDD5610832.1 hypothetical protein [Candidatus Omnitrophota bacterium]
MSRPRVGAWMRIAALLVLLTFIPSVTNVQIALAAKSNYKDNAITAGIGTLMFTAASYTGLQGQGFSYWKALTQPFVQGGVYYGLRKAGANDDLAAIGSAGLTAFGYTAFSKQSLPLAIKDAKGNITGFDILPDTRPISLLGGGRADSSLNYLGLKVIGSQVLQATAVTGIQQLGKAYIAQHKDGDTSGNRDEFSDFVEPKIWAWTDMAAVGVGAAIGGAYNYSVGLPVQAKVNKETGKLEYVAFKDKTNILTAVGQGIKTPGAGFYVQQATIGLMYNVLDREILKDDFMGPTLVYGSAAISGMLADAKWGGDKLTLKSAATKLGGIVLAGAVSAELARANKDSKINPFYFNSMAWTASALLDGVARYTTDKINEARGQKPLNRGFFMTAKDAYVERAHNLMEDIVTVGSGYELAKAGPVAYGTPVYYAQAGHIATDINDQGMGYALNNYASSKLHYHTTMNLVNLVTYIHLPPPKVKPVDTAPVPPPAPAPEVKKPDPVPEAAPVPKTPPAVDAQMGVNKRNQTPGIKVVGAGSPAEALVERGLAANNAEAQRKINKGEYKFVTIERVVDPVTGEVSYKMRELTPNNARKITVNAGYFLVPDGVSPQDYMQTKKAELEQFSGQELDNYYHFIPEGFGPNQNVNNPDNNFRYDSPANVVTVTPKVEVPAAQPPVTAPTATTP